MPARFPHQPPQIVPPITPPVTEPIKAVGAVDITKTETEAALGTDKAKVTTESTEATDEAHDNAALLARQWPTWNWETR